MDGSGAAWRALPRAVRLEVRARASHGDPHPDPAVAAVAVGWARAVGRWRRWCYRLVSAIVATYVVTTLLDQPPPMAVRVTATVVAGGALLLQAWFSGSDAVEAANSWTLSSPGIPVAPVTVLARVNGRQVLVGSAAMEALALAAFGRARWWEVALAGGLLVWVVASVIRQRRRPVVVLRPDGIEFPARNLGPLPWSALGPVRVVVMGADAVVRWPVRDADLALAQLRGRDRRRFERMGGIDVAVDDVITGPGALLRASWGLSSAVPSS